MEVSEPQTVLESSSQALAPSRRSRRWLWLLLTFLLLGGGGFVVWRLFTPRGVSQEAPQAQSIPVKLQELTTGTIEDASSFVGRLEAQQAVALRPEAQGRVTRIFIRDGDRVAAGDPIAELNPDRSQAELNAAIANINATRATRINAQAQLRAAKAEEARAAAELELQNTEYKRTSDLVSQGVLARQQLDLVTRDRDIARAALKATKEQVDAASASVDQTSATLAEAEAQAAAIRKDLRDTLVVAPIAGTVGDIPIKVGDYVTTSTLLTTITENGTLDLDISVPIERKSQLRKGLPVELRQSASDDIVFPGRISFISPQVSENTQSILAKATFSNTANRLQDAQRVEARVIWQKRPGVLVPTESISRLGGQTFVFVAKPAENAQPNAPQLVAEQRSVKLGNIQGNLYQVLEGVKAGETIVTSGILNLSDGAPIMPEQNSNAPQQGS
jgi:RND family efflux transporter MFP subunit